MNLREGQEYNKRNTIVKREKTTLEKWSDNYVAEVLNKPKYFVTFPYPYMNGLMHLGHAYTVMKADVMARYKHAKGFNVLFPFAFHATGMPIVAAAGNVKEELEHFESIDKLDKKSQLSILHSMDIPEEEFKDFINPVHWVTYFIDKAKTDLKLLGISADFTRSFTTTELNPHYDSFVKWQFDSLYLNKHITFGKRYIVYSPKDQQPCADHDRKKGEGVDPQRYTLIKLVIDNTELKGKVLLAATLRAETMYGQTNVWINKKGMYSLFKFEGEECIARYDTYLNMKYQYDNVKLIEKEYVLGEKLMNCVVKAPYIDNLIPILHMDEVSLNKGTGIVTSVPSDSPTDYFWWKKYVKDKTLKKDSIKSIIEVDGSSQYAKEQVELAMKKGKYNKSKQQAVHDKVYLDEHTKGKLLVGKYKGMILKDAHSLIEKDLVDSKDAIVYYEPMDEVISRSNDKCVVALTDQWYINYGDEKTTEMVNDYIENGLVTHDTKITNQFRKVSDWIKEWPCSRHYGLGTKLLDTEYVIDSLSDSTIYMAYYTICKEIVKFDVNDINYEVWDYIFLGKDMKDKFKQEIFKKLRNEFLYWYPLDLRVSGKDLVGNHLTMCMYNHAFIWNDVNMLPRSFDVNGYININNTKMSKSLGTFITLRHALDIYGSDATRIGLILSGSSSEDANFNADDVEEAIMLLYREYNKIDEFVKSYDSIKYEDCDNTVHEHIFVNTVNMSIQRMDKYLEHIESRKAFIEVYNILTARDKYTQMYNIDVVKENAYYITMLKFYNTFNNVFRVFCPFWSDSVDNLLGNDTEDDKSWPVIHYIDKMYVYMNETFQTNISQIRSLYSKRLKKLGKKIKEKKLVVSVYTKYNPFEKDILETAHVGYHSNTELWLKNVFNNYGNKDKAKIGKLMKMVMNNINVYGPEWFDMIDKTEYNDYNMLKDWIPHLLKDVIANVREYEIYKYESDSVYSPSKLKVEFV